GDGADGGQDLVDRPSVEDLPGLLPQAIDALQQVLDQRRIVFQARGQVLQHVDRRLDDLGADHAGVALERVQGAAKGAEERRRPLAADLERKEGILRGIEEAERLLREGTRECFQTHRAAALEGRSRTLWRTSAICSTVNGFL